MPVLNDLSAIYVGDTAATKAYLGSTEVWTAESWSYYRSITVDNTGGSAKSSWPVKVTLSSSNFTFAHARSDGHDVQFRASDGTTVLSSWRQDWDSSGQTAVFWVRVPSVGAGSTTTVRVYYGNAASSDQSDGAAVFPALFEDFDDPLATTYAHSSAIGNTARYANPVFTAAGQSWRQQQWERASAVYDPNEADPSKRWKMWTAGRDSTVGTVDRIGLLYSADGITWTEYASNPVLTHPGNDSLGITDPCVVIHPTSGKYILYCESTSGSDTEVWRFESTDGITWTNQSVAIAHGGTGAWDAVKCGTPTVWYDDATHWHMTYDGRPASGNQKIGYATSTDGITWTKSAANPIVADAALGDIVPSWVGKIGSTWYMHVKNAGSLQTIFTAADDPASWTSSSFTKTTDTKDTGDLTFINAERTRVAMEQKTNGLWVGDIVGSDVWAFRRRAATTPRTSKIQAIGDGTLVLDDSVTTGQSLYGYTAALGLTSDFAVLFRMKKVVNASDELYTQVSIGAGTPQAVSSTNYWVTYPNGYGVIFGRGGTSNTQLRKFASGTESRLGSTVSITSFSAYADYELRYRSTGALSLARNGTQLASATDTAHASLSKGVAITQGNNGSGSGAKSTWDFVLARPYDGVDPSATVGSEVAA